MEIHVIQHVRPQGDHVFVESLFLHPDNENIEQQCAILLQQFVCTSELKLFFNKLILFL